jgi:hypothetical protein
LPSGHHRIGVISFFADVPDPSARQNYTPKPITLRPTLLNEGNKLNAVIISLSTIFSTDSSMLNNEPTLKCNLSANLAPPDEHAPMQLFDIRLNRTGDLEIIPQTWPRLGKQVVKAEEKSPGMFIFSNNRIVGMMQLYSGAFRAYDAFGSGPPRP